MTDTERTDQPRAWHEGRPCPNDTNGDGDCHECHHPELRRSHEMRAKSQVQKMGVEMADAILEWHDWRMADNHRHPAQAKLHDVANRLREIK